MSGTIASRVAGSRRLCFDTDILIYFVEQSPKYVEHLRPIFAMVDARATEGLASCIALLEVLVKPRQLGRHDLESAYANLLTRSAGFRLCPVDRHVAAQGAELRARYGYKTPDAIHLATATLQGADWFITNDCRLRDCQGVQVLVLDDLIASSLGPDGA